MNLLRFCKELGVILEILRERQQSKETLMIYARGVLDQVKEETSSELSELISKLAKKNDPYVLVLLEILGKDECRVDLVESLQLVSTRAGYQKKVAELFEQWGILIQSNDALTDEPTIFPPFIPVCFIDDNRPWSDAQQLISLWMVFDIVMEVIRCSDSEENEENSDVDFNLLEGKFQWSINIIENADPQDLIDLLYVPAA